MDIIKNNLIKLLENTLNSKGKLLKNNEEIVFYCPFCNHYKKKLQININIKSSAFGCWHCWVCQKSGRKFNTLFKKVNATEGQFSQLYKLLSQLNLPAYKSLNDGSVKKENIISLPSAFTPMFKTSRDPDYKRALLYLTKRNLTISDMLKYHIGYALSGPFQNRIIVPSYNNKGNLNYFITRSFYRNNKMKYKNPSINKNNIIPFELLINWNYPITLVEGVFDAIAVKRNAIPLLGKNLSIKIKNKILIEKPPRINICLDADAIKDAAKITQQLINAGLNTYLITLPKNEDPSTLGTNKIWQIINNSKITTEFQLLKYLI